MPLSGNIRVLHVDDEPDVSELTAEMLEREDERFAVETVTSASSGLDRLAAQEFDCVVSDYEMPEMDGIEFLYSVRETYPELPFILFTGKGSEAVASNAISAGVTDYLQKGTGTERYELLANRIENVVEKYWTQQRLETQKHQYERLFEQPPMMYVVTDDDDGRATIVDCNEQFLVRLGYESEAVVGAPLADFYTEESAWALREGGGYGRALAGEFDIEERAFRTDDGERIETLLRAVPRVGRDGTTTGTLALYVDITERKQRERELQRERDRLAAVFDAVPHAINEVEFRDGKPIVQQVNDAFEDVFGYSREQVTGESLDGFIVPEEYDEEADRLNQRIEERESLEHEVERVTADGERRTFLFRSAEVSRKDRPRWLATYIDITDRKEREQAVEALHATVRAYMEAETVEAIVEITVDAVRDILEMPRNRVYLSDEDGRELVPVSWTEPVHSGDPPTVEPGEAIAWTAHETGEMQVSDDLPAESEPEDSDPVRDPDVRSQIALPLDGHGVLLVGSPDAGAFDEVAVDVARTLASHATTALDQL